MLLRIHVREKYFFVITSNKIKVCPVFVFL